MACALDLPENGPAVTPATGLTLFRIVQEALTNVARHAKAQHVRISLAVGAETTELTVADDGRGVTAEELERSTSLGIVGIRERALAVGGKVTITGSAEHGTTLTVRAPTTIEQVAVAAEPAQ